MVKMTINDYEDGTCSVERVEDGNLLSTFCPKTGRCDLSVLKPYEGQEILVVRVKNGKVTSEEVMKISAVELNTSNGAVVKLDDNEKKDL